MDEVCRLCLTVAVEMACKLEKDSPILDKLYALNVEIHLENSLPNQVCLQCKTKLEDFLIYCENIKQNQETLMQVLNNGKDLKNFYQRLKEDKSSIDHIKLDTEIGDEDSFGNDSVCYEFTEQSKIIKIKRHNKKNAKTNVIDVNNGALKRENITDENKMDTNMSNLKNDEFKSRNKSKAKSKRITKKAAKENSVDINNHLKASNLNILDNLSEPNPDLSEPFTDYETTFECEEVTNFTESDNIAMEIKSVDHKCLTCFEFFVSNSELINHYKTVHYDIYGNTEDLNESCIQNKDSSNNKSKSKNENKRKEDIVKRDIHKSEKSYICKICGRTFSSVYAIVRHGRVHGNQNLHCSHGCGYSTVYKGALRDHEKRHEKNFKYKCVTCGAGFHAKTWHDQHQNIHNNVKPFVCDLCGMAFHMDRYLTSHRTAVHPNTVKGDKRFICPHCNLEYHSVHSFKAHLEEREGKKSYLCDLCGKVCANTEQLKYHKNAHLGVKPYTCSICNKKFVKKFNLTVHQRAHNGEKQLCQNCGKYFAQRSTLRRHLKQYCTYEPKS